MSSVKSGLGAETYPGSEAQRIFFHVARQYGGQKIKAVVRHVARDLSVSFDMAFRARKRRIGARAFPELLSAYHAWVKRESGKEIEALRARLEQLEASLDGHRASGEGVAIAPSAAPVVKARAARRIR